MKPWLTFMLLGLAQPVLAQDVQQFSPAATLSGLATAKGAETLAPLQMAARISAVYARDPLVLHSKTNRVSIVRNRLDLVFSYAMGLTTRLDLAVIVPYVPWQEGAARWDGAGFLAEASSSSGLADPRIEARIKLLDETQHFLSLALVPVLTLPLSAGSYSGEPSFIFTPELAATRRLGPLVLASNIGVRLGQNASVGNLSRGPSIIYRGGVGLEFDANTKSATLFALEAFGSMRAYSPLTDTTQSPLETMASVRQRFGDLTAGISGGVGLVAGFGAPLFRTMFSLAWAPLPDAPMLLPPAPAAWAKAPAPSPAVEPPSAPQMLANAGPTEDEPILDRDNDGLADADDLCPDEPETINDVNDTDGCPDAGKTLVKFEGDEIVMEETVFFGVGKLELRPRARHVLNQVAALLTNHKAIKHVTVEGHTDSTGSAQRNQTLSTTRAEVVRRYLVGRGVAEGRLEVVGYGSAEPRAEEGTPLGKARNRRVQFRVLDATGTVLGAL